MMKGWKIGCAWLCFVVATEALAAPAGHLILQPQIGQSGQAANALTPANKRRELSVRQLTAIAFGSFTSSNSGGSIVVNPNGGMRIIRGNVSALNGGEFSPAEFEITGQPGAEIMVDFPARIQLDKNNSSLTITNLLAFPTGIITLDNAGRAHVKIGGTLNVPGTPYMGSYSGNFTIDVHYVH